MTIRVAITGFGRIGRNVLRAHYEYGKKHDIEIVAVNAPGDLAIHAHLLKHDTVHGLFGADVSTEGTDTLIVNGDRIRVFGSYDPSKLPWGDLGVDVVMECTGAFNSTEKSMVHINQGAKKVLLSAPGKPADATIVYGVNQDTLRPEHRVVSNASCTTNCLAPLAKALHGAIGIERGLMTTVHSYTNDQVLTDVYHKDIRRARAAGRSMIPTKTGAAKAVGLVLPELNGRLDGFSLRVPTINVSFVDLTFIAKRDTSVEEINEAVKGASEGSLKGILAYSDLPLVSSDYNHDPHSSIYDATLTKVSGGRLCKVTAWYDNEWGFSNRMLDVATAMMAAK
jgi:glyceraldehyde 3-phosphate dehydrogenase